MIKFEKKHLPGEWGIETINDDLVIAAPDGDGDEDEWRVARAIGCCGYGEDTAPANARLISAAPELLDYLLEHGDPKDSKVVAILSKVGGKPFVVEKTAEESLQEELIYRFFGRYTTFPSWFAALSTNDGFCFYVGNCRFLSGIGLAEGHTAIRTKEGRFIGWDKNDPAWIKNAYFLDIKKLEG